MNWLSKIFSIAKEVIQHTKTNTMLVIDVSHHQGNIDWSKVAKDPQGIEGAILKASEGVNSVDKKLAVNVKGCMDNGLKHGFYHFATWNDENEVLDAKAEAENFIKRISPFGQPSLPVVLDIESNNPISYTKQEMVDYVSSFLKTMRDAGFNNLAIYASPGFLNSYLPTNHPFTDIPLWIADYTGSINPVPGWKKAWLHQYTEKGKVQGIVGNVDLNRYVV